MDSCTSLLLGLRFDCCGVGNSWWGFFSGSPQFIEVFFLEWPVSVENGYLIYSLWLCWSRCQVFTTPRHPNSKFVGTPEIRSSTGSCSAVEFWYTGEPKMRGWMPQKQVSMKWPTCLASTEFCVGLLVSGKKVSGFQHYTCWRNRYSLHNLLTTSHLWHWAFANLQVYRLDTEILQLNLLKLWDSKLVTNSSRYGQLVQVTNWSVEMIYIYIYTHARGRRFTDTHEC